MLGSQRQGISRILGECVKLKNNFLNFEFFKMMNSTKVELKNITMMGQIILQVTEQRLFNLKTYLVISI